MKTVNILIIGILALTIMSCDNSVKKEKTNQTEEKIENTQSVSTTYKINTKNSVVGWKGSMIGVYAHEGNLNFNNGSFVVSNDKVTSGTFTIDMKSMITTDDDALYKMAPREKLIGHLQAADFFDVENHPTSTFKITSVEGTTVIGDLTIKGKTNSEKLTNVTIVEAENGIQVNGTLTFDRQKYGITYKNTMNDMVLSDDVELKITISGSK